MDWPLCMVALYPGEQQRINEQELRRVVNDGMKLIYESVCGLWERVDDQDDTYFCHN